MSEVAPTFFGKAREHFLGTWPLYLAAAVTIAFGYWAYCLASEELVGADGVHLTRWVMFRTGQPNTMGDTLAGFVGSLTLIWVVASVIQQSMELKAQRKEFEEMVSAMDQQVQSMKAQSDLLHFQLKVAEENFAKDELDEALKYLAALVQDVGLWHWEHQVEVVNHDGSGALPTSQLVWQKISPIEADSHETDRALVGLGNGLVRFTGLLETGKLRPLGEKKSAGEGFVKRVLQVVDLCVGMEGRLSDAGKSRLMRLRLLEIRALIQRILASDIWDSQGHGKEVLGP